MGIFDKWPKKDNKSPEPESIVGTVKPGSEFDKAYDDLGSDYEKQTEGDFVENEENEEGEEGEEETQDDNNIETI